MTKSLTEKKGYYYLDYDTQEKIVEIIDGQMYMDGLVVDRNSYGDDVDLMAIKAPVPSYDEYCNLVFKANMPKNTLSDVMMCYDLEREKQVVKCLQKQIDIATKALKGVCVWANKGNGGEMAVKRLCEKALKEMEGAK